MTIKRPSALVVLSGGQDSTTCLFWAKAYFDKVHAVTFNYGQRHSIEIQAAKAVAKIAGVASHAFVDVPNVLQSTSPLTDPNAVLETYTDYESMDAIIGDRVEKTFVPMRNAFFLTLAANLAVVNGIENLVTGVCQADNANYPDCREKFIQAQEATINEALGTSSFMIHTPLMHLSKAESIKLAMVLGDDAYPALAFSHTAYDGTYPPVSMDHASVLRAHGFLEASVPDPLVIRAAREGLMQLPDTSNYKNVEGNIALAEAIWGLYTGDVQRSFS